MYEFKEAEKAKILKGKTITYIANKIGITTSYLNCILNKKRYCSKVVAYSITKCLCHEAEIIDYFKKVE